MSSFDPAGHPANTFFSSIAFRGAKPAETHRGQSHENEAKSQKKHSQASRQTMNKAPALFKLDEAFSEFVL